MMDALRRAVWLEMPLMGACWVAWLTALVRCWS